jgi:hypothetical protein
MHIVVFTGSISMRLYGGVVGHGVCVGDGGCVFCWLDRIFANLGVV